MQCVILAAGRGTRMLPLTENTPKPLLKVAKKPILAWNLENLPKEIDEVIFVIGYLGEKIKKFVAEKKLPFKTTFVEQRVLDGTGGALALCEPILKNRFLVVNGDDLYLSSDLFRLMGHGTAILGYKSRAWKGSSLLVDDENALEGIEENPPQEEEKIANTGAYILDRQFFNYSLATVKNGHEFSIPHTLVTMSKDHTIFVEQATFWQQINTPEDLKNAVLPQ